METLKATDRVYIESSIRGVEVNAIDEEGNYTRIIFTYDIIREMGKLLPENRKNRKRKVNNE